MAKAIVWNWFNLIAQGLNPGLLKFGTGDRE